MLFLEENYPGVYGFAHFLYLGIWIFCGVSSLILIKKYIKNEKILEWIVRGLGLFLFVFIVINRISLASYDKNWFELIPTSFCGMSSFVLSLTAMFGKKNSIVLHAVSYSALIGGIITNSYPDFFETQAFWDPRTFSGIMHHTIDVYLIIYMLMIGWFKPSLKKWFVYPIGICITMTIGLFENQVLNLNAMNINSPLLSSAPILTSWWCVACLSVVLELAIIVVYDLIAKRKNKNLTE